VKGTGWKKGGSTSLPEDRCGEEVISLITRGKIINHHVRWVESEEKKERRKKRKKKVKNLNGGTRKAKKVV